MPKGEDKKQMRLIFHLPYTFPSGNPSINSCTPKEKCSVKYNNLDYAVKVCLRITMGSKSAETTIWYSKSDLKSAFHILSIRPLDWPLLAMKAFHPETEEEFYFFDKCLPFGASISCSHFQGFSNALRHIFKFITDTQGQMPNYLDDILSIVTCIIKCNLLVKCFLELCYELGISVSLDKTEWANSIIGFLSILLDGTNKILAIPEEKRIRALDQ